MYRCPEAEKAAYQEAIWIPHQFFLGPRGEIDDMVAAIYKVLANIECLRDVDHPAIRKQRFSRADRESQAAPGHWAANHPPSCIKSA